MFKSHTPSVWLQGGNLNHHLKQESRKQKPLSVKVSIRAIGINYLQYSFTAYILKHMEAFYLLPGRKHKFGFAFYFVVQKYKRLFGWSESRLETLKENSLGNLCM